MKKYRFLTLIFPVIAIILEILPFGAVLNFANPEGEPYRRLFSYFSLTPFGNANFAPFLCALLTCALVVLCIIYTVSGKDAMLKWITILSVCSVVVSLCPLLLGIRYFSLVGAFISLVLLAQTILCFVMFKKLHSCHPEVSEN